jgi:hypothetical protein
MSNISNRSEESTSTENECLTNLTDLATSGASQFIHKTGQTTFENISFVFNEVMGGTVNGSNKTFTLAHTPTSGSQCIYLEGQRLTSGASNDYTITGSTVTLTNAPTANPPIADYIY